MQLPPQTALPPLAIPAFDRFAKIVADRLETPVALLSLVDVRGQAFPGAFGLAEPWNSERWTPLSHSFCQHVVREGRSLVVGNAHDEPLVKDNLAVMDLGVVAYAGVPLRQGGGPVVGAVCALDHRPRQWTDDQIELLTALAEDVSAELGAYLGEPGAEPG